MSASWLCPISSISTLDPRFAEPRDQEREDEYNQAPVQLTPGGAVQVRFDNFITLEQAHNDSESSSISIISIMSVAALISLRLVSFAVKMVTADMNTHLWCRVASDWTLLGGNLSAKSSQASPCSTTTCCSPFPRILFAEPAHLYLSFLRWVTCMSVPW